jgi:hypothetical protein
VLAVRAIHASRQQQSDEKSGVGANESFAGSVLKVGHGYVSFQNRLLVFLQWAIEDLTFSRGARLITGTAATDFSFNKEVAKYSKAPEIEAETVGAPR